ncbi:MAG: glycosyltransferase family 1 protein [Pseudomonadota bacterium]
MDVPRSQQPVKVLLDITAITPPLSGIGRYALEMARHLPRCSEVSKVSYLKGREIAESWEMGPEHKAPPTDTAKKQVRALLPYRYLLGPYRQMRARSLAQRLQSFSDHVFFSPNFSMPPIASPSIVTVHDLSIFHFPEFHPRDRVNFLKDQILHSVEHAGRLVTDSGFVHRELIELLSVAEDRISVVPLGVSPAFKPRSRSSIASTLARYGIADTGYVLSVGTLEPRKNLALLLRAYHEQSSALKRSFPLVLTGASGWKDKALMHYLQKLQQKGEVIYLDYVPEEDLPAIYAGASVFVYLSHYEGFGLPVLEAMSCGIPVVSADTSALPELCNDVALFANPTDLAAIKLALQRSLEDESWRAVAAENGIERSADFTWQAAADNIAEIAAHLVR